MSYVIDGKSRPTGLWQLKSQFSAPPTQDTIALGGVGLWDTYPEQSNTVAVPGDQLYWTAGASTGFTDLSGSFIRFTGFMHLSADFDPMVTPPGAPTNPQTTVPPFTAATLLQNAILYVNNTPINLSQNNAAHLVYAMDWCVNEPQSTRDDVNLGTILDAPGEGSTISNVTNQGVPTLNPGSMKRSRLYIGDYGTTGGPNTVTAAASSTRQFDLIYRLGALCRTSDWLPPGATIRISAKMTPSGAFYQGADSIVTKPEFRCSVVPQLYVKRLQATDSAVSAAMNRWMKESVLIRIQKIRSEVRYQAAGGGSSSVSASNLLSGATPKVVMILPVRNESLDLSSNAGVGLPPYYLQAPQGNNFWASADLRMSGGRSYPLLPYEQYGSSHVPGSLCNAELWEAYRQVSNSHPFLDSSDTTNIAPLVFQILPHTPGTWSRIETDASFEFRGQLNANPGVNWAIVAIAFYDGVIKIDYNNATTKSFPA